ncbi:MAG: IS1 family transposase [Bacteroidota bacterium]
MKCKNCHQYHCIKKGKRDKKQRYFCKSCHLYFQESYVYQAYKSNINSTTTLLLKEGCGVRSISRILNISSGTVLSRILKIGEQIKVPDFDQLGCQFEVDELWSFVGSKKNAVWIIYSVERNTRMVVDFSVGRKTSENIRPLVNKLIGPRYRTIPIVW